MLLRGAYSAKYRAVQKEEVENLRDEEREEFNVKLEKTKELSRDTNRRRRALEQRRRDYEAEEEKKRREILAQRKKEIQEATEKFQRSNIVRSARKKISNHHIDQKLINQRAKKVAATHHTATSDVNGHAYYPSVEEVLAMLQSDRAQAMERLVDDKQPDLTLPQPSSENNNNSSSGGDQEAAERHAVEQERLRSEVIVRSEPKFAFDDHALHETTGSLPTTMRKDSPSGSLSSVDSLDEVPDEIAEPSSGEIKGTSVTSVASIIRNPKKGKNGNQVSFNENVTFSDGLTGVLKTKDDITGMGKQPSFFEIPSKANEQVRQNGVECDEQYPVKTSIPPTTAPLIISTPNKYPYVTVTYAKSGENKSGMSPKISQNASNTVNTSSYETSNIHDAPTGYIPTGFHNVTTAYDSAKNPSANGIIGYPNTPASYHNDTTGYPNTTTSHPNAYANVTPAYHLPTSYPDLIRGYPNTTATCSPNSRANVTIGYPDAPTSYPNYPNVTTTYPDADTGCFNDTTGHRPNVAPDNSTLGHHHAITNSPGVTTGYHASSYANTTPTSFNNATPGYSHVTGYSTITTADQAHGKPYYTNSPLTQRTNNVILSSSASTITSVPNNVANNNGNIFFYPATAYNTNAGVKYIGSQPHVSTNNTVVLTPYTSQYNGSQPGYAEGQITPQQKQSDARQINSHPFTTRGHGPTDNRYHGYHNGVSHSGKDLFPPDKDASPHVANGTAKGTPYDNSNNVDERKEGLYDHTQFSSINALRLRDSLEMNHEHHNAGETQDIAPDTPLVPITKKDFLSKALSRTNDPTTQTTPSKLNQPSGVSVTKPQLSDNREHTANTIRNQRPASARYSGKISTNAKDVSASEKRARIYTYKMDYKLDGDIMNDIEDDTVNEHESTAINTITGTPNDRTTLSHGQHKTAGKNVDKSSPTKNDGPPKSLKKAGSKDGLVNKRTPATKDDGYSDQLLKSVQADIERITMVPTTQVVVNKQTSTTNTVKRRSPNNGTRKTHARKNSANGSARARTNSNNKRLHKPNKEPSNSARRQNQTSTINIQYSTNNQHNNHNNSPVATKDEELAKFPSKDTPDMESRPVIPEPSSWTNTFDRKQYKNRDGVNMLDKTPTDDEITKLWETVRTCLKHEPTHKAASDSIVNTIRRSRSESGAIINNHYLIDNQRLSPRGPGRPIINAFGPNTSEARAGYAPFRRQNSLDGLERRGSSESSMPQRKGSLLGQRSSRSERKLTRASTRPPINPQYIQTLRRPTSSTRGPQKSNTIKQEDSKLSYAEFQAIMQASSDLQTRDGAENEQKRPQPTIHQPIIMDKRREPSALSVEEKRLLESLDRLNERLKVQEATTGKLLGHRNTSSGNNSSKILHQTSPNNTRFTNRSRHNKDNTNGSLLNRR